MTNVFEKNDQSESEKIRQRKIERQQSDMRKTLNTTEGRRVIWRFLNDAAPFQSPFVPGDPYATALMIGKKEVALKMYAEIEANQPELLQAMRREYASDKLLHDRAETKGDE